MQICVLIAFYCIASLGIQVLNHKKCFNSIRIPYMVHICVLGARDVRCCCPSVCGGNCFLRHGTLGYPDPLTIVTNTLFTASMLSSVFILNNNISVPRTCICLESIFFLICNKSLMISTFVAYIRLSFTKEFNSVLPRIELGIKKELEFQIKILHHQAYLMFINPHYLSL